MKPTTTENALHAAETWLARIGADPASVAVVTINPPAVGCWQPGAENVGLKAAIDDADAELLEAVAPALHKAIEMLPESSTDAIAAAQGARLQVLLMPAAGEIALRLVYRGGAIALATMTRSDLTH